MRNQSLIAFCRRAENTRMGCFCSLLEICSQHSRVQTWGNKLAFFSCCVHHLYKGSSSRMTLLIYERDYKSFSHTGKGQVESAPASVPADRSWPALPALSVGPSRAGGLSRRRRGRRRFAVPLGVGSSQQPVREESSAVLRLPHFCTSRQWFFFISL